MALQRHAHKCDLDNTARPSTPRITPKPVKPLAQRPITPSKPAASTSKSKSVKTSPAANKKNATKAKVVKKVTPRPKPSATVVEVPPPEPESGCTRCRRILAQILASTTKNLLLLDLGLAAAMPTIIIPVLTGKTIVAGEPISFSNIEASWYAGAAYIGQPIGSLISGFIVDPLGRKPSMILANVPYIISWILLYFSTNKINIYFAESLVGLGAGLMEAPVITYIGEICEPSLRGILVATASASTMIGFLIVYALGTAFNWRTVAIICLAVPILASVAIPFVPETPLWLLSKKRPEAALYSLRWLRGWTRTEVVQPELIQHQRYIDRTTVCTVCEIKEVPCPHLKRSCAQRCRDLFHIGTCRPFGILITCFFLAQFTGYMSMRPFMIQIFKMCGAPLDPNWATVVVGAASLISILCCMILVRIVGKRPLFMISSFGVACSSLTMAVWAVLNLDQGWISFDNHDTVVAGQEGLLPLVAFFVLASFNAFGMIPIPWILLSEVYPTSTRGLASGITASLNYVMIYVAISTFFYFEQWFTFAGTLFCYSAIGFVGFIFITIMVPETEGKTLEEIEAFFSDKNKKWYDRTIKKLPAPIPLETINSAVVPAPATPTIAATP